MPIAYSDLPATGGFDLYIVDANNSQGEPVVSKYGTDQLLMIRSKKDPSLEAAICFSNGVPLGSGDTADNNIPHGSLAINVDKTTGTNDALLYGKTVEGVAGTEKWAPFTNEADA